MNQSMLHSEHNTSSLNNGGNMMDAVEAITECPVPGGNGKYRGGPLGPESPSRFKLSMYKKNLVLDPPRRHNLTLKVGGDVASGTY